MRELLRDIDFSKNGKLYEVATRLLEIDRKLKEKESILNSGTQKMTDENLQRSFRIEYNSQSYASFYSTKLEKDKGILTLSVAGLGFLVTFINIIGTLEKYEIIFFMISAICFMVCIFNIIKIFDKNAEYIILLTTDSEGVEEKEIQLRKLDKMAIYSFYLGIIMSFTLGVCTSHTNLNKEDNNGGKQQPRIQRDLTTKQ